MAFKKTFIVSDESVNTYGFVVLTNGIVLDNAKKNCPCFYEHRTWEVPLGHWENIRVENSKLLADLVINGDNEREKNYINKIQNGDIKCASIGADPKTWTTDTTILKQGQTRPTLSESELYEISITPLPANKTSIALKHDNNLICLSDNNTEQIIPFLDNKKENNMKAIALKLGLSENATEQEMLDKIGQIQLAKTTAEGFMNAALEEAEKGLEEKQKTVFVELKKTNAAAALQFVALTKNTVPAEDGKVVKDVKLSQLVNNAKTSNATTEVGKDSYDYLQKHNKVELARIRTEEPEEYQRLVTEYSNGVRHKA